MDDIWQEAFEERRRESHEIVSKLNTEQRLELDKLIVVRKIARKMIMSLIFI